MARKSLSVQDEGCVIVRPHGDEVEVTREGRDKQERAPLKEAGRGTWACHKGGYWVVEHH